MLKKIVLLLLLLSVSTAFGLDKEPLPANQAFQLSAKVYDPNTIMVNWTIAPGYYLYRERLHFNFNNDKHAQLARMELPAGEKRHDQELGHYQIYKNKVNLAVSMLGKAQGTAELMVGYQGCSSSGFCYPPEHVKLLITISEELVVTDVRIAPAVSDKMNPIPEDSASRLLAGHHFFWIILGFFGFGLLLTFTPCVLPMIPIISGIIVGHGKSITTKKSFILSLIYVLGMAITYTIAGIVVAILGSNIQASMQNPWVISVFSLLFVLLALSMFGFYDLKLPASIENKLATTSRHQKSGSYLGVFIMGALSALIVSPCVTAPLVGALSYIAKTGDVLLGGSALFSMSLGMGVPLLIVGASAGKLLPKAGNWMNAVKNFFGVVLLAVAIFLIDRIIPSRVTMYLWSILLFVCAAYLGAIKREITTQWDRLWQGLGLFLLFYACILVIGASTGNSDPLSPLANFSLNHQQTQKKNTLSFITVNSISDVKKEIEKASEKNKPVMLDFYADWCIACKVMERTVFADPEVKAALNKFVLLKADITTNSATDKALKKHFDVIAPPTYVFFDKHGCPLSFAKVVGETDKKTFLRHLQHIH